MRWRVVVGYAALCTALALLVGVAPAQADLTFCDPSVDAALCGSPEQIAADIETGEAFVSDTGKDRVAVFDEAGTFLRSLGEGQLSDPRAIAVDNDQGSPGHHDVYVFDGSARKVLRFHPNGELVLAFGEAGTGEGQFNEAGNPIATGPGGTVWVGGNDSGGQGRVQKFNHEGGLIEAMPLSRDECDEGKAPNEVPFKGPIRGVGVDSEEDFYVFTFSGPPGVRKYDAAGNLLSPCPLVHASFNIHALAVTAGDNLFVGDSTQFGISANETAIYRYDSTGALLHVAYGNGTMRSRPLSLAPFAADLFAIEGSSPRRAARFAPEPLGPVVLPFATEAEPGSVQATFGAVVNPEGEESTLRFEFVDEATYLKDIEVAGPGHGFDHAKTTPALLLAEGAADFSAHKASYAIPCPNPEDELGTKIEAGECLQAATDYRLRAVAVNVSGEVAGPEATFTTLLPIGLGPVWATEVGFESAQLHAELNPTEFAATAYLQYVDEAAYLKDKEEGGDGFAEAIDIPDVGGGEEPLDFGAGSTPLSRSVQIGPLGAGETYRYRYLAEDFFGVFTGPESALHTAAPGSQGLPCPNDAFRNGAGARLPDCRAYELVSPVDKGNDDIQGPIELAELAALGPTRGRIDQASPGGGALAYGALRSFGDALSAPIASEYLARRDPASGWSTHALNPPIEGPSLYEKGGPFIEALFKGFSEDLCQGWVLQNTDLALAPGAPAGVPNLYRRENCGEGADGYDTVTAAHPPGFGSDAEDHRSFYFPTVQGIGAAGGATAFKAPAALTPEARTVPVGEQLRCHSKGEGPVELRWLRNGVPIAGAVEVQYETKAADAGKAVQCRAVGGGQVGFANPAQIVAPFPATLPPLAPEAIPAPSVSAPLEVGGGGGQTLECDPREEAWVGAPTSFAYQWYRDGAAIGAATAKTYLTSPADLAPAATFQCAIAGKNAGGTVLVASAPIFTDPAPTPALAPDPRVLDIFRAYLQKEGQLHLVSVLPNGAAAHTHASVGTTLARPGLRQFDSVSGALAAEGERVFFSTETEDPTKIGVHGGGGSTGGRLVGEGPARLYLRLNATAAQSATTEVEAGVFECTEPAKACTLPLSTGAAIFGAADPAGTRALFTEGEDLYEFDVGAGAAYDPGAKRKVAGKTKGLLGASADLSHYYFVSEAVLDPEPNGEGETAELGRPNLYEGGFGGGATFVGGLLAGNFDGDALSWAAKPVQRLARVSGDGMSALFLSKAPLTGYDNVDAASGKRDAEVFLYDAGSGELRCVSCNPSGARPRGRDVGKNFNAFWAAAKIGGWETQWHPTRSLSEDGSRVFFESLEALVPRDSNGRQDVYQWELVSASGQAGKEECLGELGGERYAPDSGGCLSLISSGTSAKDSEFVDASGSGSDVFFRTASSLLPKDPGLLDIYDARVGGGFPEEEEQEPECEGEACQSPPPAPPHPTPASSAFEGDGDAPPVRRSCGAQARRAARAARGAKALRRRARGVAPGARKRALVRRSAHAATKARQLSKQARRCRSARNGQQ